MTKRFGMTLVLKQTEKTRETSLDDYSNKKSTSIGDRLEMSLKSFYVLEL
jgi:hypothetical protein